MTIYIREDKRTEWEPKRRIEKERGTIINPGTRNEERQLINTVASTARMLNLLQRERVEEEDFYAGLSINAQHIGVSEDELLELATEKLELDRQEKEA